MIYQHAGMPPCERVYAARTIAQVIGEIMTNVSEGIENVHTANEKPRQARQVCEFIIQGYSCKGERRTGPLSLCRAGSIRCKYSFHNVHLILCSLRLVRP